MAFWLAGRAKETGRSGPCLPYGPVGVAGEDSHATRLVLSKKKRPDVKPRRWPAILSTGRFGASEIANIINPAPPVKNYLDKF